jgi:hypothetical protein
MYVCVSDVKLSQKLIVKAYILEAAMAVHSIIIGFDFGSSDDDLLTLKILYLAFLFHQVCWLENICIHYCNSNIF